ncbi:S8 family serine peptidase [Fictibacillus barbaricus]|uniref:S8 family serine peptidase n=1 Tax=Fictibacillus barbaricus TaxID=182136 RepID=A0ABS2ZDN1_9BACL|nr:S8 family serine peptidase [Fictibacillus barbaricus]MBN3544820.1 S8 family serine peptidase [Fictibacillus barbaricus]GGB63814.1 peptidase S8 [Fictibacillus barbaricus]
MGKKASNKSKVLKSLAVFALSSSFILGSLGHVSNVTKAVGNTNVDSLLANLTPEQRAALNQLSTNESTGLQISSDIDLTTTEQTHVIVEFANKPAKVAKIEAASEDQQLSDSEASNLVDQDHEIFQKDLGQVLADKNSKKVNYKINRSYKHAFNGVSMSLPANKIKSLLKSKAVKSVFSNETFTIDPPVQGKDNDPLKADEFNIANYTPYDGLNRLHAEGYTGKGIKVGILDTGIDYNHPDLKDAYKGGYDFVDDDSNPMETTYADWKQSGKPEMSGSSAYYTNHGTHVAGIIGSRGVTDSEYTTVGAAPEADIYAYRVLGPYGSGQADDIIAAVDRGVKDGMDVINMSLGNSLNDPLYATSIAVNNAVLSGVTTVVAAGNSGDKNYTLGSPGAAALALTVGASSVAIDIYQYAGAHNGENYNLRQLAKNYTDDLSTLKGKTLQLVDVGLGDDYTGKDVKGKFVLMSRGVYTLSSKISYAKEQGAAGVIMYNDEANKAEGAIQSFLGESVNSIPSFSVSNEEGLTILEALKTGKTDFTFGDFTKIQTASDELATFSSRGPSRINYDIKPEVTGPGVSILSTVPFYVNDKTVDGTKPEDYKYAYQRLSGTSMATPYVAGVSALLLQSNKDLEPADIKSILMNTADPLSKAYSVFEIGSGRVDAYEAIHSNVEFEVVDKTPTSINGKQKLIKELTGGISFGSYGFDDQDIYDTRNIIMNNRSEKAKTFSVNVKFQTGLRGSKDAAQNGVTLTGPTSVKLNGISQKSIKFDLNIPKTAEKGTYEGYIVFTNNADPTETYQIPFGGRVINEGIDTFKLRNPMYSGDTLWPEQAMPGLGFQFSLKSFMKTLDVVLQDSTGQDIGFLGSYDTRLLNENIDNYNTFGFTGTYYPFTGDPKNPINSDYVYAKTGNYKLKMIGTNDQGKVFTKVADFIFEKGKPTMTSSFDSLDQKVIEYDDSQFDSNGEYLHDFNINVNDPEVADANRVGIPIDQSSNAVVSFYDSPYPAEPINTDKNGNYNDQILVKKRSTPLKVQFYAYDSARNFTSGATSMLRVAYVSNTYPYYYLKANKQAASTGDTINYSIRSNNIKNLKTSKITIPVLKDNGDLATINNVVVSDAVKQYGDAQVSVTSTSDDVFTTYTITFNYFGNKALPEDMQLVNFDLNTVKHHSPKSAFSVNWFKMEMTSTTIDQSNAVTNNVYTYMDSVNMKEKYSRIQGNLNLEGTTDPLTGQQNYALDQTKLGAKVTVTSYDGKTVIEAPIENKYGNYTADGMNADKNAYTLKVDVPGHFTMYKSLVLSYDVRGEAIGYRFGSALARAKAGDANKDNVIDIMDALYLQTYWGANKSGADLNFDGVVDKKDMDLLIKNYGLQNSTVPNAPKAKTSYKGSTLDTVLNQLGLK